VPRIVEPGTLRGRSRLSKIGPGRLRPIKTLGEVKALLDAEGVQYQENAAVLDTLSANLQLAAGINILPPGEIFVIPQGGVPGE
jgi:hypothetical protein